jgi:hypothetical protein
LLLCWQRKGQKEKEKKKKRVIRMAELFCGCCGMETQEEKVRKRMKEYKHKSKVGGWNTEAGVAMLEAARVGDLSKVKAEIDRGANINEAESETGSPKYGRTALHWAIEHSNSKEGQKGIKLLEWLVRQPECDLNVSKFEAGGLKMSALHSAVIRGLNDIGLEKVRILLSQPERIEIDPKALDHANKLRNKLGESFLPVIKLIQDAQGHQDKVKAEEANKVEASKAVQEPKKPAAVQEPKKPAAVQEPKKPAAVQEPKKPAAVQEPKKPAAVQEAGGAGTEV